MVYVVDCDLHRFTNDSKVNSLQVKFPKLGDFLPLSPKNKDFSLQLFNQGFQIIDE